MDSGWSQCDVRGQYKGLNYPRQIGRLCRSGKDPRTVPPDTIQDMVIEATYLGGEKVYIAPGKAVAMIPPPSFTYDDGNYRDGDEEENQRRMFTELADSSDSRWDFA